ncbi:hypothetical protein AVEN_202725-1, partial [Araneus ventricosus]
MAGVLLLALLFFLGQSGCLAARDKEGTGGDITLWINVKEFLTE